MPAETRQPVAGQHRFTVTFRGYKPAEVDQVVAELGDQVENLVADLDRLSRENSSSRPACFQRSTKQAR